MNNSNNDIYEALCDIPKATEEQFLRREFRISLKYIDSSFDFESYLNINKTMIIVTNNPNNWTQIVKSSNKCRLIFFLIGNETYEPDIYNSLNQFSNLLHAFIYNFPTKIEAKNIVGSIIGYIYDGGLKRTKLPGSIYRDARISISLKQKFNKFIPNFSFSELPQGYSNNFIYNLQSIVKIPEDISMINKYTINYIKLFADKKKIFSFIGQSTNRRREVFLRVAQKQSDEKFKMNLNFQGTHLNKDSTYVTQLLENKFTLIPPGFYNNYNHRYTESLICGSIPIILANNSLDPSVNKNWTRDLSFLARFSIRKQIKVLLNIDDFKRTKLLEEIRYMDFQRIDLAAKKFRELVKI
jgi:hypothetical protein